MGFSFSIRSFHQLFENYSLEKTLQPDIGRKLVLLTSSGQPFAERGQFVEAPVKLREVPQHLINALLAIEDRRFYRHIGIDPVGMLRAATTNFNAGRIMQGGSTLTQQLAKISYLSHEKTLERKLEEAGIALWLELNLTKKQILERYLSSAYFGDGCYGLRAAARRFFDKRVSDLTLSESIHLVALLKSPSTFRANQKALRQREKLVIQAMAEENYLDSFQLAKFSPVQPQQKQKSEPGAYFADWIELNFKVPSGVKTTPLRLRTSLDLNLQKAAMRAVAEIVDKYGKPRKVSEAALIAMRPDGRIVAMVGGRDYARSQFNRAKQAFRQPGSAFKLFVYLAALRAGAELDMQFPDQPMTIGDWSPENYTKRYRGMVSLE